MDNSLILFLGFIGYLAMSDIVGTTSLYTGGAVKSVTYVTILMFVTVVFLLYLFWKRLKKDFLRLRNEWKKTFWPLVGIALGICAFELCYEKAIGLNILSVANQQTVLDKLSNFPTLTFAQTVLLTPIVEEFAFRYGLYEGLIHKGINSKCCIAITSLAFALMHLTTTIRSTDSLLWMAWVLPYFAPSAILCLAYKRKQNIVLAIVLHCILNLCSLVPFCV